MGHGSTFFIVFMTDRHQAFEFLKHVPVSEIIKHKGPVVEVKADTPIETCLDILKYVVH